MVAEGAVTTAFGFATDGTGTDKGDGDVAVTVADAVTVAEGVVVAGATSGALDFTTGISGLVATMADGEGTVEGNFETVADRDTDIKVEVTDTLNVAQAATIAGETTGQVDFSDAAGITDDIDNLVDGEDNASGNLVTATATGSANGDDDVNVTVNDAVTVAQAKAVAGATSGTLDFTTGISGLVATMANAEGTVEADFETVADRDTDIQVVVTDTLNVAQAATIAGETTGQVDFSDVAGITDSAAAMATATAEGDVAAGTITTAFSTATTAGAANGDGATAVTVNTAANVAQAGTIAGATTGQVDFAGSITDTAAAMATATAEGDVAAGTITTAFSTATTAGCCKW